MVGCDRRFERDGSSGGVASEGRRILRLRMRQAECDRKPQNYYHGRVAANIFIPSITAVPPPTAVN